MVYYDSDKNEYDGIAKVVAGLFFVPWLVMLAAGTLAHHHPDLLHVLWRFSYWDWILIWVILSVFRNGKISKWYRKED